MTLVPRYELPIGSEVTLFQRKLVVLGQSDKGYEFSDPETGLPYSIPFQKFVDYLKLPGTRFHGGITPGANLVSERLGGYKTSKALSKEQQEIAKFNTSICKAIELLIAARREENGNPKLKITARFLDQAPNRKFLQKVVTGLFGQTVYLKLEHGGRSARWILYKGRTLLKYYRVYEALPSDVSPLDALVTLDHLKGNRTPRLCYELERLMFNAWNEFGLDKKGYSIANVRQHLEGLVGAANAERMRNRMPALIMPSNSSLKAFRDRLISSTELAVAVKGEREARNLRGRGSTDIRALLVGEYVEMDECKASLVISAKMKGIWYQLSDEQKETLKKIDEEIRTRLTILVMIDVASRMPLAWVISDQPKAQATLELLRMATRDKFREKRKYGCSGEPARATGLGHVKNDNGPGLRNSQTIAALMGCASMNTIARAYASTDKPYIERMFGTVESVLLKLIMGYTGRKPGELPGYDAKADGVLNVEELYAILTRFFIDEYPSLPHFGVGMGGRRPADVYREINDLRGQMQPMDPNLRRIHLGWEESVTPTDEGVRVFGGIFFNSDELQKQRDDLGVSGKVKVFVDPDDMNLATVVLPKSKEILEVELQITAFADMTLPEILHLMALWRKEDPVARQIHEDRLAETRRQRRDLLAKISAERKILRSYSTIDECRKMARAVFAGARVAPVKQLSNTVEPGRLAELDHCERIVLADDVCLLDAEPIARQEGTGREELVASSNSGEVTPELSLRKSKKEKQGGTKGASAALEKGHGVLGRPENVKGLK